MAAICCVTEKEGKFKNLNVNKGDEKTKTHSSHTQTHRTHNELHTAIKGTSAMEITTNTHTRKIVDTRSIYDHNMHWLSQARFHFEYFVFAQKYARDRIQYKNTCTHRKSKMNNKNNNNNNSSRSSILKLCKQKQQRAQK